MTTSGSATLYRSTALPSLSYLVQLNDPSLQRFRGIVNIYMKFICQAAKILHPLTSALKGSPKIIFRDSDPKSALLQIPRLVHPVPSALISIAVDISESHIGAVLQHRISSTWAPLVFFSKKLSTLETCYRELLAAYSAISHFQFLLEGRQFTLFTNHKPLTHALLRVSPPQLARQKR